jgi:hypothetical protein
MNRTRTINTLWSESLFEQPICVDGVQVNKPRVYKEEDLWDLTGIFDGTHNWEPKTINTRKIKV